MDIKQSERGKYKYFNNANVIELDHQKFCGKYVQNISSMHLSKAYFDCLFVDELQIIIAGAGGQKEEISSNVIETFDLNKNRWNVVAAKTNHCYESVKDVKMHKNAKQSILWTDVNNPFVVNMCNGTDFCEFIDLRICKEWVENDQINAFLKQMKQTKKEMNGQILI